MAAQESGSEPSMSGSGERKESVLDSLPPDIQALLQQPGKHTIHADGSVTVFPSPFLTEQQHNRQRLPAGPLANCSRLRAVLANQKAAAVEALSTPDQAVVAQPGGLHSFVVAAEIAWAQHYPLRMAPQDIWLLILQGVAIHVNQHSEQLRERFVTHEGKKTLTVVRASDQFVLGKPGNDWQAVVAEFAQQIDANTIADTGQLLASDFSCASVVDKAAAQVTLMDICQDFFEYFMMCMPCCGFPSVTLEGRKEDWQKVRAKAERVLAEKVLPAWGSKWAKALLPVLDRFVAAFDGEVDCVFWNSMVKRGREQFFGSGGPRTTVWLCGWFNVFFPYLDNSHGKFYDNRWCEPYDSSLAYAESLAATGRGGPSPGKFPYGVGGAPVAFCSVGRNPQSCDLKFLAGFVGCTQDEQLALKAHVCWVIAKADQQQAAPAGPRPELVDRDEDSASSGSVGPVV